MIENLCVNLVIYQNYTKMHGSKNIEWFNMLQQILQLLLQLQVNSPLGSNRFYSVTKYRVVKFLQMN
jgi:hypothetical protein